ncbi:phenylalanine--tRNA (Phe) ligase beta subunit [Parastagonospora nodorum]|uniref:Phenylalanine--tRNA ligase beta subunit n=1 Tax=Phaeosphaeria nodorum (strain SN15 / ATCC MYA-4574 / FGSC 10173) TaxID=321614 RepID=A0A7U2IB04_PHANO|nr:phenylalanine--tRNA (Phe) ligase beta subunit [Parastagonospora nodorum]QRD06549.1 phenylalanine--tRNA (Phe) ligase beta subunit [Parastagonospora nodorum SN15]KAH3931799.1 phenylalanine--tRNA (Phe) ligase beta subunit [Parastagonospora nodorum]KAH3969170.1 phenylalanine--tRNA (Phe) ligase beta subunit [Parastagonospora nodorum]KAH3972885.1 phenylalanine--tRNA (Phe) ligase beta subunit [Parastagonospora nodorum]
MPTIGVDKAALFKELGREYTTEEFDELCFEFGIELDEDTSQSTKPEDLAQPPQLKIEIPANRYDMLCFEGIAMNLKVFLEQQKLPKWSLTAPKDGELQVLDIKKETEQIRPLCSGVILRNIEFTQERYDSFIALQDKLHANLARNRTLVSIGTHDLDTIKGPFSYEALAPEQIEFIPLNQTKKMNGKELMEFYDKDKHLGRFLHIIRDSPVYPVIYDSNRTVLSLPPIINGDHSKITLNTKNVLIEITALDKTKVEIVNHMLVAMFAGYAESIEALKINSPHNNESREAPDLSPREMQAEVDYLNQVTGLSLQPEEISKLLSKMGHDVKPSTSDPNILDVSVPVTRADILHQADIMEDYAIAYGFNKLPRVYPNKTAAVSAPLPINKLADIVRLESAAAGWTEVMPLILCSHEENFEWLNRVDDGKTAVKLANPKTAEYQLVRTSLLPGLLKTINSNKHHAVPMKIFEVSDVGFIDLEQERKSRNERHFAAAIMGKTSGFEQVHGLLDRVMLMLRSAFITREDGMKNDKLEGYWIEEVDDPTFLPGHAAAIKLNLGGKNHTIGVFGILHPSVLGKFELPYPVSTVEINLEVFL